MCGDLDSCSYLNGQGHTIYLKVKSTHARVCSIAFLCIDGLQYNLVQIFLIETMCGDLDSCSYLNGQGHMRHLKDRVPMLVSPLVL